MLVEPFQGDGSTGGIALAYPWPMHSPIYILSLSLIFSLACGDDGEPTRPADGTVEVWESCVWEGQQMEVLCATGLSCSSHGVCSPTCDTIDNCPTFDGFNVECSENDGAKICRPKCNASNECPKTGGVELHCSDFFCVGDS